MMEKLKVIFSGENKGRKRNFPLNVRNILIL